MGSKQNVLSLIVLGIFCILAGGSITPNEFIGGIIFAVIVLIALVLIFWSIEKEKREKRKNKIDKANDQYKDFNPTVNLTNYSNQYTISIDKEKEKILIIQADDSEEKANTFLLDYEDIISVQLMEDKNLIYSKSTLRTIGGGLVGGLVAGGAGAIIGGLSGSSNEKKMVSNISIKLLIRNLEDPSIELICYKGEGINANGPLGKPIIEEALQVIDHIKVIIDYVDKKEKVNQISKQSPEPFHSLAEELEKLHQLKERGILSEEEYRIQKEKILNKQ